MNKLPKVEGLLSYLSDNKKLYIKEKSQWTALANQKEVRFTSSFPADISFQNINVKFPSPPQLLDILKLPAAQTSIHTRRT